jgi:F0F1-type ATP synthase assembly protein I
MDLQFAKALPWFLLTLVILGLYLYVRSRRTRRK